MKTLTVDDSKRIRLPDAKPRQVFAYENRGGTLTLTPVAPVSSKPVTVRVEKRGGFSVGVSDQPISLETIKEALSEFP